VADVRGQRRGTIFRPGGAFPALRARSQPVRQEPLQRGGASPLRHSRRPAGAATLHAGRHLHAGGHGGVGLGAAGAFRAGRRGLCTTAASEAAGRCGRRAASGAARGCTARQVQVQDRDRRRGAALPVPANASLPA
jgi:hypothetical protein